MKHFTMQAGTDKIKLVSEITVLAFSLKVFTSHNALQSVTIRNCSRFDAIRTLQVL